uniref:RNA helicase n=1 Tax=Meloidogyne javanica TaxID=6303 RepID=A0A915MFK3_MELJA
MLQMKIKAKFPNITTTVPTATETQLLQLWMADLAKNGINVKSHIRLFVYEFVKYVGNDTSLLVKRFAGDRIQEVHKWLDLERDKALSIGKELDRANTEALAIVKSDLFKYISHSNDPDALPWLLAIISHDPQSFAELHLNNLTSTQFYSQLFSGDDPFKVDRIRSVLEPRHIFEWFKNKGISEYEDLLRRIEMIYVAQNQAKREIEAAACLFIRGLAHCSDIENSTLEFGDWYYEFIEALLSHGDCRFFARLIDPNYVDSLDKWKAKKMVAAGIMKPELLEYLIGDEEEITEPRNQINYLNNRSSSIESYEPEQYDLRPYQNELVLHANNGRNTIICAPTGSGKTLVAVDIIKNHLSNRHRDGKIGRCVMLVPTVPLVDQQALHFVQFLMDYRDNYRPNIAYWVDGFSGCENIPEGRADRLLAADIVVMTPQILINMLESILRSERVYFADFTLMIFDECHHATKLHPYKILMEMLEKSKLTEKPQIVGLTASMGVGDTSLDINACYQHMLNLCSNLHSETISTVRHQLDNLKTVTRVKRPANDPFLDYVERVMYKIENEMKPHLPKLAEMCKLKKEEIEFPLHSNNSRYQTVVGTLKKSAQRVQDSEMRFLLHYFHSILINDLLPSSYAFYYLQEKMSDYKQNSGGSSHIDVINQRLLGYYQDLQKKLYECVKNEKLQNKEILKELHLILRKQFKSDPNSRCLIFVATRNCASKLADHLKKVPELPIFYNKENVGYMVSSNQSLSAGGQSTQEQQQMIRDFDSGKVKVLVVTSVAEEGVNIAACNLIIKYNNVGSERSMIQRRGRARQKNSLSILLALDTGVEQAEYLNMQKEAMV